MNKMIIGFSTDRYLILDLDHTTAAKAEHMAITILKNYKLHDCLVMRSSGKQKTKELAFEDGGFIMRHDEDGNYHLIFGDRLFYQYICYILDQLADLGILSADYVRIRDWRGDLTLRVSADNSEDAPRPPPIPIAYLTRRHANNYLGEGVAAYLNFYIAVNGKSNTFDGHHFPKIVRIAPILGNKVLLSRGVNQ